MAINTLATETLFQRTLDKLAVQEAVTGWMDANAGQVIYSGGKEVKIPKLSVQGLANYDRDNGYVMGGATMAYETLTMTQDRGRKFQLDAISQQFSMWKKITVCGNVLTMLNRRLKYHTRLIYGTIRTHLIQPLQLMLLFPL